MAKTQESAQQIESTNANHDENKENNLLQVVSEDCGRKITFDNLDYKQEVHYMTEDHQNEDKHCVTMMSTENRVPGNQLSDEAPSDGVLEMFNGVCIPSANENMKQKANYITLVERIIVENIPCLNFLSDVTTTHIPHQYRTEMMQKTDTTFLGIMDENENDANGIIEILKSLHDYVPFHGDGDERVYASQGVVGDQLSVERGVNGHMSLANGFTPEERLDGLHFEVADWHAGNKFLEVGFSKLYSAASGGDKCTLFSDRNLINRRNVKSDVSSAANACRRFFTLEVQARVVAAALNILGMSKLDGKPTKNAISEGLNKDSPKQDKKAYLNKVASLVVDTFIVDKERNQDIEQSCQHLEDEQKKNVLNAEGRYPCRYPGCKKTFAHDGKLRREHEEEHNPPAEPAIPNQQGSTKKKEEDITDQNKGDDMLAYQRSLLDYGMLLLNFWDAISEGDGQRVIRCWKFFLLYLKHEGGSSKYSLEALYLMFQIYALLSPRSSHRLIWNRFSKNKSGIGGHIPLDLQLEFFNKSVKEAIKKLGPAASQRSLDRICHSLRTTMDLMANFDTNLLVYKRSGKHIKQSAKNDLEKVVKELVAQSAFTYTEGRRYQYYVDVPPSILSGFDMQKMYTWINQHKKYMILNRRAR